MATDLLQTTSTAAACLSTLAAVLSGVCAFLSYKLARKIQNELQSDERIIAGIPIHPDLRERAHSNAVIQCTLFNKSKRKAYASSVSVYDQKGTKVDATWSDKIDDFGNPQNPCQLVGIIDSCQLYIRRNDGEEFDYARIELSHSFSNESMNVIFDPLANWGSE